MQRIHWNQSKLGHQSNIGWRFPGRICINRKCDWHDHNSWRLVRRENPHSYANEGQWQHTVSIWQIAMDQLEIPIGSVNIRLTDGCWWIPASIQQSWGGGGVRMDGWGRMDLPPRLSRKRLASSMMTVSPWRSAAEALNESSASVSRIRSRNSPMWRSMATGWMACFTVHLSSALICHFNQNSLEINSTSTQRCK